MRDNQIRNKNILGPVALLERRPNRTPQLLIPQGIRLMVKRRTRTIERMSRLLCRWDGPLMLLVDVVAPRDVGEVIVLRLPCSPHDGDVFSQFGLFLSPSSRARIVVVNVKNSLAGTVGVSIQAA